MAVLWLGLAAIGRGEQPQADAVSVIDRAWIASDGQVMIQSGGETRAVARDPGQVSSRALSISPDRQAVGWLAETPSCCTPHPEALTLVLYRLGRQPLRLGNGLAIRKWTFRAGGSQVALNPGPAHGGRIPALQLFDAMTGRLLDSWFAGQGKLPPEWASGLAQ